MRGKGTRMDGGRQMRSKQIRRIKEFRQELMTAWPKVVADRAGWSWGGAGLGKSQNIFSR